MKSDRKPPLARSPMTLRGRRPLQPPNSNIIANTPLRTPAMMNKPQMKGSENMPENNTVSCELRALAKMVQDELGAINAKNTEFGSHSSIGGDDEPKSAYNLGVKLDSTTKKKDTRKKTDSLKKTMMAAATYSSVDRSEHPRYALRSTARKPPLPVAPMNVDETARKAPSTRARRK
uniref:Uncharacterized protein n=1 Tax=Chenopodium quinoa TaxID=63459 RepID=A0A803MXD1_CHEQI